MTEFKVNDVVVVSLKDGFFPGVVCTPIGRRMEDSTYVHIFSQKYPQWFKTKTVSHFNKNDIGNYMKQKKKRVKEAWEDFQEKQSECTSKDASDILVVVNENIFAGPILHENQITDIETKKVISVPLSEEKPIELDSLVDKKGLLVVGDHIKPFKEAKETHEKIIILTEECEKLKEIETLKENDERWQAREKIWEEQNKKWEEQSQKNEDKWKAREEEWEKQTKELTNYLDNLKLHVEPLNTVYLGALFYKARDKIAKAYRSAEKENDNLPSLVNDHDIMDSNNEEIFEWCEEYLKENGLAMEDLKNIKKKTKEKRDGICHNPKPNSVGDAITQISSLQDRENYTKFFHFVYPDVEFEFW